MSDPLPPAPHRLGDYIEELDHRGLLLDVRGAVDKDSYITLVSYDSREVCPGTLFLCKGAHFTIDYLHEAVERGAIAYVAQEDHPSVTERYGDTFPRLIVSSIRPAIAWLGGVYYDREWDKLTIAGVTGTKGKSSTAYFLKYILDAWAWADGRPESAILSSIHNDDGVTDEESHLTTPEILDLHRHFHNMVASEIDHVTMEVSSQGLKYDRLLGVNLKVGCFLNIGQDHISPIEHPTHDDYLNSKLKIFRQCETAVVNLHTAELDRVLEAARQAPRMITFGRVPEADVYGHGITPNGRGLTFTAGVFGDEHDYEIAVPGIFNVDNALAAIAMSHCLGVPTECVQEGLAKAHIDGRMEMYVMRRGATVIVDYAHNAMSFEALFSSVAAEYPHSPVSIVFGCPGGKALDRRHDLGTIAGNRADSVYLTEEDPGDEAVADICAEIEESVLRGERAEICRIIPDREVAIREAMMRAHRNQVVLVTGKGRETRQKRGSLYVETPSDVDYVERYLNL